MRESSRHVSRISELFPELEIRSVDADNDGLTNDVVVVNNELVFRFPKNEKAQQELDHEARVLALVNRRVDVPTPVFQLTANDCAVYEYIPGEALRIDGLWEQVESTKEALAQQLAGFLRQMHAIPQDAIERHGVGRSGAARTPEHWAEMFEAIERDVFPYLWADQKEWVRRHFEPVLEGRLSMDHQPVLIYGDLGSYHVLFDLHAAKINGIIDFGTAGLGDAAADFGTIINQMGERFLARMARYYPDIGNTIERARFRAGAVELEWALNGIRSKEISWFMAHIGRPRDVKPIESSWEI